MIYAIQHIVLTEVELGKSIGEKKKFQPELHVEYFLLIHKIHS